MSYETKNIRNVCLLGHGGSGKTTLAESMLYLTGAIDRQGKTADGNTVCDYDPEEIKRKITISTSIAPVNFGGCKINILDCPGFFDFAGDARCAMRAAEAGMIFCTAKDGIAVGAERCWKYLKSENIPCLFYISKTDEENSDYNAAFDTLRERFGKNIAPVVAPIWDESKKVIGIIDVLHKRAFEFGPGGGRVEIEVPENKKPVLDELYDALKESVAETSEEFMEKFFAGEDFTYAEMIHGLRQGVKDLSLFPVVCGSAIQGMGTRILMDTIVELLPKPQDARALMAENEDGESSEFVVAPGALPTAFVFKTISDQYGKYSYVKVLSGSIKPDMPMVNARTGETEKLGRLYIPKGKKYTEVKELTCGDIKTTEVGQYVSFSDANVPDILEDVSQSLINNKVKNITGFDVTDTANIKLVYDGRIDINIGLPDDIDYKIRTAMTIINEKLDPNNTGLVAGTLDVSACSTSKISHYKPAATQPTAATQATTQATTQAADSSADTGDGYTGNYTWDDGTYSGGDTGYYDNNSYNNYDNGTYDNGNADGAYTGE